MWDLNKLKGLAGKGKVSRRDFIQFAIATGVTVAAAETMFVDAVRARYPAVRPPDYAASSSPCARAASRSVRAKPSAPDRSASFTT